MNDNSPKGATRYSGVQRASLADAKPALELLGSLYRPSFTNHTDNSPQSAAIMGAFAAKFQKKLPFYIV